MLDVSEPTHPQRLTSTEVTGAALIRIRGQYAYVTAGEPVGPPNWTIEVLDLATGNPHQRPPIVGTVGIDFFVYEMTIAAEFLYLRKPPGMEVWDLTDPVAPAIVAKHESLPFVLGAALVGADASVLCLPRPDTLNVWLPQCGAAAVDVSSITPHGGPDALKFRPHPLRPHGTISFIVERPGRVRLGVFDVAGRLIRRLTEEQVPRGTWRYALGEPIRLPARCSHPEGAQTWSVERGGRGGRGRVVLRQQLVDAALEPS